MSEISPSALRSLSDILHPVTSPAYPLLDRSPMCEHCGSIVAVRRWRALIQVGETTHPEVILACDRDGAVAAASQRNGRVLRIDEVTFFD